ncbi:MAG: NAD(P)/FAD-dependent oxidoreductase, partial [Acidobacteriota bacterium]
ANARLHGLRAACMATADLADRIPLLAGAATPIAVACRDDGRIDPCGLAKRYLAASREGGVTIMMGARATGLRTRGETVTGVETSAGFLPAEWVVNAAGAWAGSVGSTLGEGLLDDLGLTTHRRHLFRSTRVTGLDPRWPFVWDLSHDVYFLTDASYLTLSACDEEPHPAVEPAICARAGVELDRKLSRAMPAVARIARAPLHACLRTFSTDRRFVVGPDPRLSGFFWVAGLGGSGATAGAAAGDLAAGLLLGDRSVDETARRAFDPARLVGRR